MGIVTNSDLAAPLSGLLLLLAANHVLHRAEAAAVIGCARKCQILLQN